MRALAARPSGLLMLETGLQAGLRMLDLAARHALTARRIHDARHAATALIFDVHKVFTYDIQDWKVFSPDGVLVTGPPSVLQGMIT